MTLYRIVGIDSVTQSSGSVVTLDILCTKSVQGSDVTILMNGLLELPASASSGGSLDIDLPNSVLGLEVWLWCGAQCRHDPIYKDCLPRRGCRATRLGLDWSTAVEVVLGRVARLNLVCYCLTSKAPATLISVIWCVWINATSHIGHLRSFGISEFGYLFMRLICLNVAPSIPYTRSVNQWWGWILENSGPVCKHFRAPMTVSDLLLIRKQKTSCRSRPFIVPGALSLWPFACCHLLKKTDELHLR
jgi:hypothetical protein